MDIDITQLSDMIKIRLNEVNNHYLTSSVGPEILHVQEDELETIANRIAFILSKNNHGFNQKSFLIACGFED